jgi:hypothetical protein
MSHTEQLVLREGEYEARFLIHAVIHPAFAPGVGSKFRPPVYLRQSAVVDLGVFAKRAAVGQLVMTHMIPALDTASHGPFKVPGGPLKADDYEAAARESGFEGEIHLGTDLLTLRLP